MADDISRRGMIGRTLAWAAGVPLLAGAAAATSPLLRVLRPTCGPFDFNEPPDAPPAVQTVAATLADQELQYPWGFKSFVFAQMNVEYTPDHLHSSTIPGFVVKVPPEVAEEYAPYFEKGPVSQDPDAKATAEGIRKGHVVVFSRICVHLGCVFNYYGPKHKQDAPAALLAKGPSPATAQYWTPQNNIVQSNYNFPGALPNQGYFSCPCHFSVYDLNQLDPAHDNKLGRVVSGPAPRPPRFFFFSIDDKGNVLAKGVESGGVA